MSGTTAVAQDAGRGPVPAPEPDWLRNLRDLASSRLDATAWPTRADEEWRRTDLGPYGLPSFLAESGLAAQPTPAQRTLESGDPWAGSLRYRDATCTDRGLRADAGLAGVLLLPLEASWGLANTGLEAVFARGMESARDKLSLWHYRSWSHGANLIVPAGAELTDPIVVDLYLGAPGASLPHLAVRLEPGSRAIVVVRVRGEAVGAALNGRVDLDVGEAASLRYVEMHELDAASLVFWNARATVARDGRLEHTSAVLGSLLHRGELDCLLAGPGAEAMLRGLYFATGRQHVDLRTAQRHLFPRASSQALFKGAARDEASTVFQGLIDVAEHASKTDAYLANRNLLLGGTPRADSIPSLSIRNDDLRCSHGSTTGKIAPEERFYLMSRGLPRAEAQAMIVEGYFEEVIAHLPEGIAAELREGVLRRLVAKG